MCLCERCASNVFFLWCNHPWTEGTDYIETLCALPINPCITPYITWCRNRGMKSGHVVLARVSMNRSLHSIGMRMRSWLKREHACMRTRMGRYFIREVCYKGTLALVERERCVSLRWKQQEQESNEVHDALWMSVFSYRIVLYAFVFRF